MDDIQVLEKIKKYVQKQYQMVVATSGEYPWGATVYYSSDEDLNLYFLSDPSTIHCKHIAENPKVSAIIAENPQSPSSKKRGLVISGICEQVGGEKKITHALNLWRNTLGVTSDAYTYAGMMKKAISGRMYKITPERIKFFNEELWEEGEERMIEL